ncbi:MAG: 3'(2'),5'-bisphosphate nucleotidase CysQ [Alphaproteobacteria bacterium]|nr:3'(2'),5'-bisphosphate nucleotidase CysQ [Alphaproteobacteria bacterium]
MRFDQQTVYYLVHLAFKAGQKILEVANTSFDVQTKRDGTFVTQADQAAHTTIHKGLLSLNLPYPIISEEGNLTHTHDIGSCFWLVDPLDGTNQFIKRRDEYTVNVALIQNTLPVFGVIYHPPSNTMHVGYDGQLFKGKGMDIHLVTDQRIPSKTIFIGSTKENNALLDIFIKERYGVGYDIFQQRSSLKFCSLAEKKGSLYYRSRPSYEWDTAAGHALLSAMGGKVLTLDGNDLIYGKENFENPGFIASL